MVQVTEDYVKLQIYIQNVSHIMVIIICDFEENQEQNPYTFILIDKEWTIMIDKTVEEINRRKMIFFSSLSHEMRTPLNCSISMLELLER